jgi:hypothetical protein
MERIRGSDVHSQHRTDGQVGDMERIRGGDRHLLTGERRTDGQVRMQKESCAPLNNWWSLGRLVGRRDARRMPAYSLLFAAILLGPALGLTVRSDGHSRPGECRWMDKSGRRKDPGEQGALMKRGVHGVIFKCTSVGANPKKV